MMNEELQIANGGLGNGELGWVRLNTRARGVALMEVVVALSVLFVAMAVVGMTFRNGHFHVEKAEQMVQAELATERVLAHLDMGMIPANEQEVSGWFDVDMPPGMSWRVEVNPDLNLPGIVNVDVYTYLGEPDGAGDRSQLLLATRVFRAEPRNINFETDFGLTQEQLDQLTDAIPGGAALFDPRDFDLRSIAQLDLETIQEMLPSLIQAFGGNLAGNQLETIIQAVQSGDLSGLQNLAGQLGNLPTDGGGQPGAPQGVPGGEGTNRRRRVGGGR